MTNLTEVNYADIKNIFNASYRKRDKVTQFGQYIDNPNLTNVNDPTLIDTLDLLHDLYDECDQCFDMTALNMHDLEQTDFDWVHELEETVHINTYNWSAPLTNDLDFKVYHGENKMYILLSVQNGYSDARCGYMVEFLFIFDTSYIYDDWAILFSELPSANKSFSTSNDYSFSYDIFSEAGVYNIYKNDGTYDEYDVYIADYEDCEKYIAEIETEAEV